VLTFLLELMPETQQPDKTVLFKQILDRLTIIGTAQKPSQTGQIEIPADVYELFTLTLQPAI